jgi:3-dehydroquinate dehydratase-2
MHKVLVLNGPNLNRLDLRDKSHYGSMNYEELTEYVTKSGRDLGLEVEMRQTNQESTMIEWLQDAAQSNTPVIINPAAFTHYSYAIRDAAELIKAPIIEVHLSNPLAREEFRHTSVISGIATGTIAGFGPNSYGLALQALSKLLP